LEDNIHGTTYFKWKEMLRLVQWNIHVYPTEDQYMNLIRTMQRMHWIREFFRAPITVTSGLRPSAYNKLIGGAHRSTHIEGKACDFQVKGVDPDEVRKQLLPLLDQLDMRMESLPGASWVHIDIKEPGRSGRYFKP